MNKSPCEYVLLLVTANHVQVIDIELHCGPMLHEQFKLAKIDSQGAPGHNSVTWAQKRRLGRQRKARPFSDRGGGVQILDLLTRSSSVVMASGATRLVARLSKGDDPSKILSSLSTINKGGECYVECCNYRDSKRAAGLLSRNELVACRVGEELYSAASISCFAGYQILMLIAQALA
ncbi:hypothetical protein POSPLADRAFT_1033552 [Postia placenta MAD-698-R-SB12]|uniref:Uncharacterized protein n=1 Tax=Postia placenta MAD-698-R-SB12 TaxID=670580 RepID=A0A1X6N2V9_9APHY|nr:hypothetical protein POSPLADRAFT_1033552 [Postia placenta MAD-698-R-SB12]OSX62934.1 hypothetical protein POSPLADRAFT_1033552 [Postia placenta MAD-698-R-SB12]